MKGSSRNFSRALRRAALLHNLREGLAIALAVLASIIAWANPIEMAWDAIPWPQVRLPWMLEERRIAEAAAQALHVAAPSGGFPSETLPVLTWSGYRTAKASYLLDASAQEKARALFATYRPDYGALVAMDATTGRVLSLVTYTKGASELGHLGLRALFPAASVFKIVTAAAVLDGELLDPDSIITFRGRDHTLFKRHLTQGDDRAGRKMTLKQAFARSVNTVFGKIGAFVLSPPDLQDYAQRFFFNQLIPGDIAVEPGHFAAPAQDDPWELAELASGFNRSSQMSPLQGALIAAAIANDGVAMEPHIIENLTDDLGTVVYEPAPRPMARTMSAEAAGRMRQLMRETITEGTSRKAFRGFFRHYPEGKVEVGGKTGSLSGALPRGKCDWFVGYAIAGDKRIALAALTVNERYAPVKSSALARKFFESELAGAPH